MIGGAGRAGKNGMAKRVQRKRTKGWRMSEQSDNEIVYVGRPTVFGNPFDNVLDFRLWLGPHGERLFPSLATKRLLLLARLEQLRGKDLCCWCPLDKLCHADILLEFANQPVEDHDDEQG